MARQTSYTVHMPPTGGGDERIEFVPDAFSGLAFVAPWAWFLWHRMWLATLAYLVLISLVTLALAFSGIAPMLRLAITAAISLLIGLEATNLRRWTLGRRGYREAAVVVAGSRDEAERRYFTERHGETAARAATAPRPAGMNGPAMGGQATGGPDMSRPDAARQPVLGLFPEAEPGRGSLR